MSPDPGNAGADPSNPQSWNMYSYVMNNPLMLTDPTGMFNLGSDGSDCDPFFGCGGFGIDLFDLGIGNGNDRQPPIYSPPPPTTDPNPSAGDPDPDGPFSGPIWQEGGPQIPTGNLAELLGVPDPPILVFDNNDAGGGVAAPTFGERMVCAANTADQYSIAGALGTTEKTGFFANVFNGVAGNTFSGGVMLFNHGNKWRFTTSANNLALGGTGAAVNALTDAVPITELGLTETVGGEFLGASFGLPAFAVKLGYDALSFTGAYLFACK